MNLAVHKQLTPRAPVVAERKQALRKMRFQDLCVGTEQEPFPKPVMSPFGCQDCRHGVLPMDLTCSMGAVIFMVARKWGVLGVERKALRDRAAPRSVKSRCQSNAIIYAFGFAKCGARPADENR